MRRWKKMLAVTLAFLLAVSCFSGVLPTPPKRTGLRRALVIVAYAASEEGEPAGGGDSAAFADVIYAGDGGDKLG